MDIEKAKNNKLEWFEKYFERLGVDKDLYQRKAHPFFEECLKPSFKSPVKIGIDFGSSDSFSAEFRASLNPYGRLIIEDIKTLSND